MSPCIEAAPLENPSVDFKPLPEDLHNSTNSDHQAAWNMATEVMQLLGGPDLKATAKRVQEARDEEARELLRHPGLGAGHLLALEKGPQPNAHVVRA